MSLGRLPVCFLNMLAKRLKSEKPDASAASVTE